MEVRFRWLRWFPFSIRWFSGFMWIFRGLFHPKKMQQTKCWAYSRRVFPTQKKSLKPFLRFGTGAYRCLAMHISSIIILYTRYPEQTDTYWFQHQLCLQKDEWCSVRKESSLNVHPRRRTRFRSMKWWKTNVTKYISSSILSTPCIQQRNFEHSQVPPPSTPSIWKWSNLQPPIQLLVNLVDFSARMSRPKRATRFQSQHTTICIWGPAERWEKGSLAV